MNLNELKTKGKPCEIDIYVGQRIREARNEMDLTQEQVAAHLGISFQQIQKYERGSNRIAAGRLAQLSKIFRCPIAWFFPDEYQDKESLRLSDLDSRMVEIEYKAKEIQKLAERAN